MYFLIVYKKVPNRLPTKKPSNNKHNTWVNLSKDNRDLLENKNF